MRLFPILAATIVPLSAQSLKEATVEIPGVRIFYVDSGGTGTPVILLHPATGSVRVWENQVRAITAAGFRFIAYDRRGWGRSVVDPSGPQPGTGADDLENLVKALKLDRFHLVGSAGGGIVALDYALSFPQRLHSLVLANTIGGAVDEEYQALSRRIRPKEFDPLPPDFKELGPAYRAANKAGTEKWLELEHQSRPAGPRAQAQTMRNRVTFAMVETIKTPTLLISGGADLYAPPPVTQLFANRIKGSKLITIPDSGHSSYWEAPDVFNKSILQFLRQHK